ncbi:hypothetical protein MBLNU459_g5885t1 [Dothideomycetes sp. NU459]
MSFARRILARTAPPLRLAQTQRAPAAAIVRPFSRTHAPAARKDAQDKDSLKPESNEYSKSGSDDDAARVSDTAFDPAQTRPEEQESSAGRESSKESNPLNASPANPDISKPRPAQEGGHEGSSAESGKGPSDRARTSGGGSPEKGSSGQKYSS